MFSVLIEAEPLKEHRAEFLAKANMLRPELETAPGFVDHVRYRSLKRDGWILSLSSWRDERSVVGWHDRMHGDEAQGAGWAGMLADYRLRVGEVTWDTYAPDGQRIAAHFQGETGALAGAHVTLIDAQQAPEWARAHNSEEIALYLGFDLNSFGDCISWDVFEALLSPGDIMLLVTWKDAQSANDHAATQMVPDNARVRVVRVIRDYSPDGDTPERYLEEAAGKPIQV